MDFHLCHNTHKWLGRVVVPSTGILTNRLLLLLVGLQRGLCHRARVTGTSLRQISRRRHIGPPRRATASLNGHFDVVSGPHNHILGILVTQIVHVDAVDLHQGIASHQARRIGQTASVDLEFGKSIVNFPLEI